MFLFFFSNGVIEFCLGLLWVKWSYRVLFGAFVGVSSWFSSVLTVVLHVNGLQQCGQSNVVSVGYRH